MAQSLFEFGWQPTLPKEDKIYGVAVASVVNNIDLHGEARIQVSLPWAPGYQPWARIATLMAGMSRGTFFIPQIGDEVLVAFNHGDIREPYIIGALWNSLDKPPSLAPTDAVTKRVIRTPLGQEVSFDDAQQSITISNMLQHKLALGPGNAQLSAAVASSVSLDLVGNVTIRGSQSITLTAPNIQINGTNVTVAGTTSLTLNGGTSCTIMAGEINIG